DVALLNSGAIRGNRQFKVGPLTRRDVHQLLPFDNIIVLVELPGSALRAALEHGVDALPRPAGRFLQTAGLSFSVDINGPPGARIGAIAVNGQPLDASRTYRVALIDFLAAGRDDFAMLSAGRVLIGASDGPALPASVIDALREGRSP